MVRRFFGIPMLAMLRGGLNTWPARLFLRLSSCCVRPWASASDILRLITDGLSDTSVATVANHTIELPDDRTPIAATSPRPMRTFGESTDRRPRSSARSPSRR